MEHEYEIIVKANIEIGGKFRAESLDEAIEAAMLELRSAGELSGLEVERATFIDENEAYGVPV